MIALAAAVAVVVASAALNRMAGGGVEAVNPLPGRAMLYAAAGLLALASAAYAAQTGRPGLVPSGWLALTYAAWRSFAWGSVYDLGHLPDEPPRSWFGELFFVTGNDAVDLWLRMAVGLYPGLVAAGLLARSGRLALPRARRTVAAWLAAATLLWVAYVIGWALREHGMIAFAELIGGAGWGFAALALPVLDPRRREPGVARFTGRAL